MKLTLILRRSLLLLLLAALVFPGGSWVFRLSVGQESAVTEDVAVSPLVMDDMPCGGDMDEELPSPGPSLEEPCDEGCCQQPSCDLSACISTGVIPSLAWLSSTLPAATVMFTWATAEIPSQLIETQIRPPIA